MYKNILFRVDSSSSIGTGHIMRDLVLASQFAKKASTITFATQNLAGNINKKITDAKYDLETLKSNSIKELDKLIKKLKIDLLVIDHYDISYKDEKKLKTQNSKLKILCFDDTYEKHHCDILLNHNISADAKKYKNLVPKKCKLRCGSKYTLIRDEFKKAKAKKRKKKYDILVAMGGADSTNINIAILKNIPKYLKVSVLTTSANAHLKELKEFVTLRKNIELFVDSKEVAKLIGRSKLAIITPSVMVHEVMFMKVTFIAIKTTDNQDDIYNYLKEKGFCILQQLDMNILSKYMQKMSNKCELINFIDLSLEQKKMILSWRNDERVKQFMYTNNEISLENHLNFIESLKADASKIYFLVKRVDEFMGVIDFVNITKESLNMGLYANPALRGVGKFLLENIISHSFDELKIKKIYAEVFSQNEKAYNMYLKYGFKRVSTKEINSKRVICMELKNENR